jgi:uncharacterized membrane protein YraQ (UPF0718 family)
MDKKNKTRFINANKKTAKGILGMLPIILGVILLVSIITVIIPLSVYQTIFTGNIFFDAFKGATLGSVLTGNPITGYILADGFTKVGVNMIAITAFLVSWVTVGLVQLPAESLALGKKFAFYRNLTAFLMSIVVAIITTLILNYI